MRLGPHAEAELYSAATPTAKLPLSLAMQVNAGRWPNIGDLDLGDEEMDLVRVIEQIKPDIVVMGHDQQSIKSQVEKANKELKADIEVYQLTQFGIDDLNSTSKIKRRIVEEARTRS